MIDLGIGWWGVPLAVMAGAVRAGTPFLFVSLGESSPEKSGASISVSKVLWSWAR